MRKSRSNKVKMSREFSILKANRAIFSMILIVTTFISNSSEIYLRSSTNESEDDRVIMVNSRKADIEKGTLLSRLLQVKSVKDNQRQFFKYRHWYFKPRRKFTGDVLHHFKFNNIETDDMNIAKASEVKLHESFHMPMLHKSSSYYQDGTSISQPIHRRRRSYNYDNIMFGSSLGSSMTFGKSGTNLSKIYHKSTSTVLQITPDGRITGVSKLNKYCFMVVKGVNHIENKTVVKIFGEATKLYLAMKANGMLYTTSDPNNSDSNFLHEYEPNNHDAFLSQNYRRYVTMNGQDGNSSPAKARSLSKSDGTPKRALFLEGYIEPDVINELKSVPDVFIAPEESEVQINPSESAPERRTTAAPKTAKTKKRRHRNKKKRRKGKKRKRDRNRKKKRKNPTEGRNNRTRKQKNHGKASSRRKSLTKSPKLSNNESKLLNSNENSTT